MVVNAIDELREQLESILDDIKLRLRLVFTRGTVTVNYPRELDKLRKLQVTGMVNETSNDVEHAEPMGLAAEPLAGAEPFLGVILGQRGHLVAVIVSDPRAQPTGLKAGEVVVWSPHGQTIWLKENGDIDITAPNNINMTARNITLNAAEKLELRGDKILGRATSLYQYGTNGHGWNVFPTYVDAYTGGAVAGTTHPISPSDVPEE